MTIKDRILTFLKEEGVSREDFYRSTGLSASNFKGAALKSELGGDKIVKILTTYKSLSPDWLLMGEGSMLKQSASNEKKTDNTLVFSDKDTSKNRINQEETSYIYKMYQEEREEKKKMLEEKESKIDHLQSELRSMAEELATLKAQYQHPGEPVIAFTPGSSEAYTESSLLTKKPITPSKRSSAGKT